jgi:hypothetical protein
MHWKIVLFILLMIFIFQAGCTEAPITETGKRHCDWVGPGGRAVYMCKPG